MMEIYEEISTRHPELILLSKSPVTWHGFLIISHSLYSAYDAQYIQCPRIKLQLVVPNYPSLCNAEISFGRKIAFLSNKEFIKNVKKLMTSSETVSSFLVQLQLLISKYIPNEDIIRTIDLPTSDLVQDIKEAVTNSSDVRISCNGNLNVIKLSLNDVSIELQKNNDITVPWKIISSDLPELNSFEKYATSLSIVVNKFKWQVELLREAWAKLKEIDENFWVVDPLKPNKSHMHRRIHLSQSVSVIVKIDPLNPTAVPQINFLGTESEVNKQEDNVNIHKWNEECSFLENLRTLLNTCEFPEEQKSVEVDEAIIGNRECGICFFEKSDTDDLPDKICNNKRCMKHYHSLCLSKWLQINAKNQVVFDRIHGICPHCKEIISCSTKW